METRLAAKDDARTLATLHAESFGPAAWTLDQVSESLLLKTTLALVAEYKGAAYGFIMCQVVEEDAEILTICVSPASRRSGVGQTLLEAAIESLRKRKTRNLFLEVAEDNVAAKGLYEKAGFCVAGRREKYYKREGYFANALRMSLDLQGHNNAWLR
ncbi:MAG: ribosomal protein S18-alanine N-acetyltransferase [Bdellovibrionales bacterium]